MSLAMVETALLEFLETPEPRVVALSGKWGLGKTYFWRQLLKQRHSGAHDNRQYAYLSLFGMPDLQALKDALFVNAKTLKSLREETLSPPLGIAEQIGVFSGKLKTVLRSGTQMLERLPKVKDFGPLIQSAAFLTVSEYVVCVDDLERHSSGLSIKDALGLISMLREERRCRILVILNTDALDDTDREAFEAIREKVFDYELTFDPTPAETARIVFSEDSEASRLAADHAVALGIGNIRVLLRIKRLIQLILPEIAQSDNALLQQLVHSAVLLCWCHNAQGENAPPLSYVKNLNYASFIELPPTRILKEEQKQWNEVLQRYKFSNTDDFDLALCDCLERGYLVEDSIRRSVRQREHAVARSKLEESFQDAWGIFLGGFGDDASALISAFDTSLRAGARWISIINASAATAILRALGEDALADALMHHWIDVQARENPSALAVDDDRFLHEVRDPAFIAAARAASSSLSTRDPSLAEVVATMANASGWSEVEVRVMAGASEDDYYALFKSVSGPDARPMVRACLRFYEVANASVQYLAISERAKSALRRIGRESTLNCRRVQSFGVSMDDLEEQPAVSTIAAP